MEDVGQFPGEIHGVADAGVHALAADGAVDVGGVAEEEHAAFVEVIGDAVVDVVGAEPVHFVDVDAEAVDDGGADVVPGEAAGFVGEFVADGADEAGVAGVVEGEDREEVGFVECDVELAVDHRAGGGDVGDVEEAGVGAAGEVGADYVADGGVGAVAAGDVVGRAGLFGAVGEAEAGFDLVVLLLCSRVVRWGARR